MRKCQGVCGNVDRNLVAPTVSAQEVRTWDIAVGPGEALVQGDLRLTSYSIEAEDATTTDHGGNLFVSGDLTVTGKLITSSDIDKIDVVDVNVSNSLTAFGTLTSPVINTDVLSSQTSNLETATITTATVDSITSNNCVFDSTIYTAKAIVAASDSTYISTVAPGVTIKMSSHHYLQFDVVVTSDTSITFTLAPPPNNKSKALGLVGLAVSDLDVSLNFDTWLTTETFDVNLTNTSSSVGDTKKVQVFLTYLVNP